jgi:hypothetical protein
MLPFRACVVRFFLSRCVLLSHAPDVLPLLVAVDHPAVASNDLTMDNSRYAFVMLGGVRQMLLEGHDYTCPRRYLQEARVPAVQPMPAAATAATATHGNEAISSGSSSTFDRFVFHTVLGVRSDGVFRWGKPFVQHAAVEVEMLEEFQGPVPVDCSVDITGDDLTMARYRVKHIAASLNQHSSSYSSSL